MSTRRNWATWSWVAPWAFLAFALLTEYGTVSLGGDIGGMLYAGFHFAVNPILGVAAAAIALVGLPRVRGALRPLSILGAVAALGITFIGATGSFWLTKMLGLRFQ